MKKSLAIVLIGATMLASCGPREICGVKYQSYGLLDADDVKNPDIQYKLSLGSLIMGVLFFETIIVPIYVFGFDLFEPVGKKPAVKGAVAEPEKCK